MTNLEALRGKVPYPVEEQVYMVALAERNVVAGDDFMPSKGIELAKADCIVSVLISPNISEGGYSISKTEAATLRKIAGSIYSRYGEKNPFNATISNATNRW